jgi:Fic family protein
MLTFPVLNLSPWLEDRKDEYKEHLLNVSATGDFNPWVQFFSDAVIAQANDGVSRIEELLTFRQNVAERLANARARGVVLQIAEDLLGYPIITPTLAANLHNVTYPPANAAIAKLVELGILREVTGRDYGRLFVCGEVMNVLQRQ